MKDCFFVFQAIVHSCLFFFLLRVMDIWKTEGDIKEACIPGNKGRKTVPVANLDIIANEDDDVSQERERVKDLSGKSGRDVSSDFVCLNDCCLGFVVVSL